MARSRLNCPIEPMDLANMRANSVRSLDVTRRVYSRMFRFCHTKRLYRSSLSGAGSVPECASMGWTEIGSILGKGVAIAIAYAGAFVIANYALDWL
jgi:hypothetical protein